jgi:uncharacterized membrane protein
VALRPTGRRLMLDDLGFTLIDWAALAIFIVGWLVCEPMIRWLARSGGALNRDLDDLRLLWMQAMARRETRIVDGQLLGHTINSASFFASANLILIAAVAGVLFGGDAALSNVADVGIQAEPSLLEAKLALILVCLARGLLDFIWAIRQLNYTVAIIGAAPEGDPARSEVFARAAAEVLNPAMHGFNRGVRVYYFALAAGAWLFSPILLALGTVGAVGLLAWRQARSPAARGVHGAVEALNR